MLDRSSVCSRLIRRLGLDARSQSTVGGLLRRIEAIQVDPVNLVARNHELVLHNRLINRLAGQAEFYQAQGGVFEYIAGNRALLPLADLPLFVPFMRRREAVLHEVFTRLSGPIRYVLGEFERRGALSSREITCAKRIRGYWDREPRTKETTQVLQYLWECGRLTVVGKNGLENIYDLSERALPAELLHEGEAMPLEEARRKLREKYYRALAVFDAGAHDFGWQRLTAADRAKALKEDEERGLVERLPLEGVRRPYWTLAGLMPQTTEPVDDDQPVVRLLSPLDNLLWRRERLKDLFEFDYRWEIYIPAVKRKGGPYTMPILYGTKLVGRLDARMERDSATLIVESLRYEPVIEVTQGMQQAVREELERLRVFCRAEKLRG